MTIRSASNADEIWAIAEERMQNGDFEVAAKLFLDAGKRREEDGRFQGAMACFGNALISYRRARGNSSSKASLMLRMRSLADKHPDEVPERTPYGFHVWLDLEYYDWLTEFRPKRALLQDSLSALEAGIGVWKSELFSARGTFFAMIGEFREAHEQLELAWSRRSDTESVHSASVAVRIAGYSLNIGNLQLAQQWLKVARSETLKNPCRNCEVLVSKAELDCLLFSGADYDRIRPAYRRYVGLLSRIKRVDTPDEGIVKVELLNGNGGDPGGSAHPARRQMLLKGPGPHGIVHMYRRSVMSTHYHLACLRYSAGLEPVEDGYYSNPQRIPTVCVPVDRGSFYHRLQRARLAAERSIAYARKLDGWLECDWRQRMVESRRKRIEEIATAVS